MKNLISISISTLLLFLFVANVSAQQWTDEQKAVWAGVETYWQAGMSEDPSGILSYFVDSYFGGNIKKES